MSDSTGLRLVTFEATSARDVLDKLHREIDRIECGIDQQYAGDHITNAFWTAWHVHKWLWDAIKEQPQLKAAVFTYRGLDGEAIENEMSFGNALAGRFVPLKICRIIATSPKSVRITLSNQSQAEISATDAISNALADEPDHISTFQLSSIQGLPAVVIMGRPVTATRLLREISEYWVTLIHECGIEVLR